MVILDDLVDQGFFVISCTFPQVIVEIFEVIQDTIQGSCREVTVISLEINVDFRPNETLKEIFLVFYLTFQED